MAKKNRGVLPKTTKQTRRAKGNSRYGGDRTITANGSTILWSFAEYDLSDDCPFCVPESEFFQRFLPKLKEFSRTTWGELTAATHDQNKSKHHHLSAESLSKEAQNRLRALRLDEEIDSIYSISCGNFPRIIGLREHQIMYVLWFDAKHAVAPSNR